LRPVSTALMLSASGVAMAAPGLDGTAVLEVLEAFATVGLDACWQADSVSMQASASPPFSKGNEICMYGSFKSEVGQRQCDTVGRAVLFILRI
jgi:hypothetical protein